MIILLKMGDPLCRVVCRVIWTSTVESLHPKDELDSSKIEAVPLLILLTLCSPFSNWVVYSHWGVRGCGGAEFANFDDGCGLTW